MFLENVDFSGGAVLFLVVIITSVKDFITSRKQKSASFVRDYIMNGRQKRLNEGINP